MAKILNRSIVVLFISILTSSVTFAETIKQKITFTEPVIVNGTVVQKGTYDAVFDDQANELSIIRKKTVIATSPARLEERVGKDDAYFILRQQGDKNALVTVSFKKNQVTLVDNVTKATVPLMN